MPVVTCNTHNYKLLVDPRGIAAFNSDHSYQLNYIYGIHNS